jgi:hypothetical protein
VAAKGKAEPLEAYRVRDAGTARDMTEETDNPREDDRNEEIEEPPAPDPEETRTRAEDDPEAD